MEIVFWVIIAIIVLAIFYVCAVSLRKRKEAFENLQSLTSRPIQKSTESICRREEKLMTILPKRFARGANSRVGRMWPESMHESS